MHTGVPPAPRYLPPAFALADTCSRLQRNGQQRPSSHRSDAESCCPLWAGTLSEDRDPGDARGVPATGPRPGRAAPCALSAGSAGAAGSGGRIAPTERGGARAGAVPRAGASLGPREGQRLPWHLCSVRTRHHVSVLDSDRPLSSSVFFSLSSGLSMPTFNLAVTGLKTLALSLTRTYDQKER